MDHISLMPSQKTYLQILILELHILVVVAGGAGEVGVRADRGVILVVVTGGVAWQAVAVGAGISHSALWEHCSFVL
jgi:hypothetical protein